MVPIPHTRRQLRQQGGDFAHHWGETKLEETPRLTGDSTERTSKDSPLPKRAFCLVCRLSFIRKQPSLLGNVQFKALHAAVAAWGNP